MKRAKRGLCVCLAACVCLMGGSLLTSCADDSMGIVGFDVESSVTAKYGSFYSTQTFLLTDDTSRYYDVDVSVVDNKTQEEVLVVADTFRVESAHGYTIYYKVKKDGNELTRTTTVEVDMSDYAPIVVDCPALVDIGSTVEIDVQARYGVESYSVSLKKDGADVAITEGTFQATSAGVYNGSVSYTLDYLEGAEKQKVHTFTVVVRDPIQDALRYGVSTPLADKGVEEYQYEGWTTFTGWEGFGEYSGEVALDNGTKSGDFYSFNAFNWGGYVSFMPDYSLNVLRHFLNEGYFLEMDIGLKGLYKYTDKSPSTFKSSYALNVLGSTYSCNINEWTTVKMDLRKYIALAEGFINGTANPAQTGLIGYTWTVEDTEDVFSNCYVTPIRLVNRMTEDGISSPVLDKAIAVEKYEAWSAFSGFAGCSPYVGEVALNNGTKNGEFYALTAYNWGGYVSLMPDCSTDALRTYLAEGYSLEMDIGLQGLYNSQDGSASTFKTSYLLKVLGVDTECKVNEWTTVRMDLEDYIALVEGFVNGTLSPTQTGLVGYVWTAEDTEDVYTNCYLSNIRLVKNA